METQPLNNVWNVLLLAQNALDLYLASARFVTLDSFSFLLIQAVYKLAPQDTTLMLAPQLFQFALYVTLQSAARLVLQQRIAFLVLLEDT